MALNARGALFKSLGRTRTRLSSYRPRGIGGLSSRANTYAKRAASLEDVQWDSLYDDGQINLEAYVKQLDSRLSRSWLTGRQQFTLKRKINTVQREFSDQKFEAELAKQLNAGQITPTQAAQVNLERHKATLSVLDPDSKRFLTQQEKVNDLQRGYDRSRRSDFARNISNQMSQVRLDNAEELQLIHQKWIQLRDDANRTGDVNEALAYDTRVNESLLTYQRALVTSAGKGSGFSPAGGGVAGGGGGQVSQGISGASPGTPSYQSRFGYDNIPGLAEAVTGSSSVRSANDSLVGAQRKSGGSRASQAYNQYALAVQYNLPPNEIQGYYDSYQNALESSARSQETISKAEERLEKAYVNAEFDFLTDSFDKSDVELDIRLRNGEMSKEDYFESKLELASRALTVYQQASDSQNPLSAFIEKDLKTSLKKWAYTLSTMETASTSPNDFEIVQLDKDANGKQRGDLDVKVIGPGEREDFKRTHVQIGGSWIKIWFEGQEGDTQAFARQVAKSGLQGESKAFVSLYNNSPDGKGRKRFSIPVIYQDTGQSELTPVAVQALNINGKVSRLVRVPFAGPGASGFEWRYIETPDEVEVLFNAIQTGQTINPNSEAVAKARELFGDNYAELLKVSVFSQDEQGRYTQSQPTLPSERDQALDPRFSSVFGLNPAAKIGPQPDLGEDTSFTGRAARQIPTPTNIKRSIRETRDFAISTFAKVKRNVPFVARELGRGFKETVFDTGKKEAIIEKAVRQNIVSPVARAISKVRKSRPVRAVARYIRPKRVTVKPRPIKKAFIGPINPANKFDSNFGRAIRAWAGGSPKYKGYNFLTFAKNFAKQAPSLKVLIQTYNKYSKFGRPKESPYQITRAYRAGGGRKY